MANRVLYLLALALVVCSIFMAFFDPAKAAFGMGAAIWLRLEARDENV